LLKVVVEFLNFVLFLSTYHSYTDMLYGPRQGKNNHLKMLLAGLYILLGPHFVVIMNSH